MIFKNIAPAFLLSAALLCVATAGCESVVEPELDSRVEIQKGEDGEPGKPRTGNNRGADGNGADGGSANGADGKNGESTITAPGKNGESANGADGKSVTGTEKSGGTVRGSGKVVSVTRKLEPFKSLVVSLGDRLEIIQGDSPSLTIEAEEEAISLLESSTEDGTLHLRWKSGTNTVIGDGKTATITINGKKIVVPAVIDIETDGKIRTTGGVTGKSISFGKGSTTLQGFQVSKSRGLSISGKNITINGVIIDTNRPVKLFVLKQPVVLRLTVTDFSQITTARTTQITCNGLRTQSLNLLVSGSSRVSIGQLTADDVSIRASGSGSVSLAGTARQQTIRISGSAVVEASRLSGNLANVRATGSGNATVAVTSSLDVRISGSARVRYSGSPDITKRISGSGKLVKGN